jgi:phage portal protein, HK97 family
VVVPVGREIQPATGGSWLARLLEKIRAWRVQPGWSYSSWLGGWVNSGQHPMFAPSWVGEDQALGIPPFGRGVELIAAGIAGLPLHAHRRAADGRLVRLPADPAVLVEPCSWLDPWQWLYGMSEDLVLFGNSFALLDDPGPDGWPLSLTPVPADVVDLGVDAAGRMRWRVAGTEVPFGSLLHVSAGTRSGRVLGRGVLAKYREALGGSLEIQRHARRYFGTGGLPSAVFQVNDPDLKQQQADTIKARYRETIGAGSHEPLVIPATFTFTPVVSDADKQQLVEARKWDAQMVAMMLGIPPYKLGLEGTSMTYQNVEQGEIAFVTDVLRRYSDPIERAVARQLLQPGTEARFDFSERLRVDAKTRAEVDEIDIRAGIRTVEEVRRDRDLPPLGTDQEATA